MLPHSVIAEIGSLGLRNTYFKPHKLVALLSAILTLKDNNFVTNRVYYSEQYKKYFFTIFNKYASEKDRNRAYTPFFYLRTASFWKLVPKTGKEVELKNTATISGPSEIDELIEYAEFNDVFMNLLRDDASCLSLENYILERLSSHTLKSEATLETDTILEQPLLKETDKRSRNPFVLYLNSLQRLEASNENAIAESQACNPSFSLIQVSHPLSKIILSDLARFEKKHVILTGHAGDGKSTIAVEVYKLLRGISADQPLTNRLKTRENIQETDISIIKDLSERSGAENDQMLQALLDNTARFFIVSNTGTLLKFFCSHASVWGMEEIALEDEVLKAMSHEQGVANLNLGNTQFIVYNLARIDNLSIARQIFERMLAPERWSICANQDCQSACPIYSNVQLIQKNQDKICERIFLAYRRMYEYGTRLTMRQLTEHLAYLITSGLNETDIDELMKKKINPQRSDYMFYNRFFGDNGHYHHKAAQQIQAIREILKQGFGIRTCPTFERRIWHRSLGKQFNLGIDAYEQEFQSLKELGSSSGNDNGPSHAADHARRQVRRMLYFLYDFQKDETNFLCQYLNSPMILRWQCWQLPEAKLDGSERFILEEHIYHVLQEHFTGVRLPEGSTQNDRRLYVTLNRQRNEIRQSAQIVLAQVDWSTSIELNLILVDNILGGQRRDLFLKGLNVLSGANLRLTLPFLDYVVARHFGELGELLQAAYSHRLEQFKSQVQYLARIPDERIMLVRLKTDHTFRRQYYAISNGKLEVSDVM